MKEKEFPQKIRFGQAHTTRPLLLKDIKLTLLNGPEGDFRELVYKKVHATWEDQPTMQQYGNKVASAADIHETFMQVLRFQTLPNSMESLIFDFRVDGLPMTEVTHLLRHRSFFGIHAQCSGDRDLRHMDYYYPESIWLSEFKEDYRKLMDQAAKLYAEMVDSKQVSLMDARYVLPRADTYFYYFSCNLKDAMGFIKQRRCTMVQPEVDNYLADQMLKLIASRIPEILEVLSIECDNSCHYVHSPPDKNTRLYAMDENHKQIADRVGKYQGNSVYGRTRQEIIFNKNLGK